MKTKIKILLIAFTIISLTAKAQSFGSQEIKNDAFSFSATHGDLKMRRYNSGDLVYKRALVPLSSSNMLVMNYDGDFTGGVRIMGSLLRVDGTITSDGNVTAKGSFSATNPNNNNASVSLNWNDDIARLRIGGTGVGALNGFEIQGVGNKSFLKLTQAGTALFDGNVGIGTQHPDAELTVRGIVHCEEVLVDLDVPADYVFQKYYTGASELKENYTMPTLEEVAAYTEENHHLPNIPSAQEIQEEGLQLKEMTNLLLQKIEELTLYTIEQEKRIKNLEAQLQSK